jgi:hypothetical protein
MPRTVVYGLANPLVEGTLFNFHPIPKGYAIVRVDRVKHDHHRRKLEYPGENGEWKLKTIEGSWSTLEGMVNGNLKRTLVVTSYGASGTLSLVRKTLNLPVRTRHCRSNKLIHCHH